MTVAMSMEAWLALAGLVAVLAGLGAVWLRLGRLAQSRGNAELQAALDTAVSRLEALVRAETQAIREEEERRGRSLREEVGTRIQAFGDSMQSRVEALGKHSEERFASFGETQNLRGKELQEAISTNLIRATQEFKDNGNTLIKTLKEGTAEMAQKLAELTAANEQRQEALRQVVEQRLDKLREENTGKLEEMRRTVDEKLQGTLEKRLGESFKIVSERLEKVHQGLGEMQTLATGVGDLKRALMNVKVRGGWAEVQLGALLEQMLTPEQYAKNVRIKPQSQEAVEFAITLPGQDDGGKDVLLPIDAKFPHEDFDRLNAAMEQADAEAVEAAAKQLERAIRTEAKRISDKYIDPPATTDFAILFLPTEGLFAEVIRRPGLANEMQQKYRVMLTGPTTLGALLNSLQMGFRTLAIQKRSGEVWKVLGEAKAEFMKYGDVWDKVKKQLTTVSNTVEEAGRRTRAVERKLRDVETLEPPRTQPTLIDFDDNGNGNDGNESTSEAPDDYTTPRSHAG